MKQKLDLANWIRKDHFYFFNKFEEPYHSVNIQVDCTIAYQVAKEQGVSFWLYYLYKALEAAQQIESFKYRIEGDEVFIHDQVDAGTTISRSNGTFGFGDFIYSPNLEKFIADATGVVQEVQSRTDLEFSPAENVIRFSVLPWIDFTALSHARMFAFKDSCPKISFGKMTTENGKRTMPMSIHVHHALIDGRDLALYLDRFQDLMNEKA